MDSISNPYRSGDLGGLDAGAEIFDGANPAVLIGFELPAFAAIEEALSLDAITGAVEGLGMMILL
jgi:hypothetical protein